MNDIWPTCGVCKKQSTHIVPFEQHKFPQTICYPCKVEALELGVAIAERETAEKCAEIAKKEHDRHSHHGRFDNATGAYGAHMAIWEHFNLGGSPCSQN